MVLDDDADEKWRYREHTAAKHEVYRKYLTPWTNKLGKFNKIRVVDCFAGRGSYVEAVDCSPLEMEFIDTPAEIPGSPQIILDRLTARSQQFEEAECFFIEDNDENFKCLKENIDNTTGVASNVNKKCVNGKFQNKVLDVVESTDGNDCPTLFFIDPFGFKALDYDVITEIGSTPQFEFLITFMARDINRFFEVEYHEEAIEGIFGNSAYEEEISEYNEENWEPLVEYYTDRLEENGPKHTFEYLITEPDTRQTVYYLVFGSNHPNGLKTMREVMHYCGTGDFGYAPMHVEHDRNQTGLAQFGNTRDSTKSFLLNNFSDFKIEFEKLVEECSEVRKYGGVESDYRKAIQELEKEGKVEVTRIESEPGGVGVQRGDLIDFRTEEMET